MRTLFVVTAVLLLGTGLGTALAQSPPESPASTPGPDEIVFVGSVPVPAGTTVTLRVIDLDVGLFSDCDTALTFAGPGDVLGTSSFRIVLHSTCLREADGAMLCWSSAVEDCNVLAAPEGLFPDVAPLSELVGQTTDIGLRRPRTIEIPVVPEGRDGAPIEAFLPATGISDPQKQAAHAWLLWAGIAALGAGLVLAGGSVAVRKWR